MKGILEVKGAPKSMKKTRWYIQNSEEIAKMDISRGDILHLNGIGSFKVTLFIVGTEMFWIDVE